MAGYELSKSKYEAQFLKFLSTNITPIQHIFNDNDQITSGYGTEADHNITSALTNSHLT